MRQMIAILVIILISIASSSSADKVLELLHDDSSTEATKYPVIQKDAFDGGGGGCPLCDASVYSYCDHKIFHDACCCGIKNAYQCQYTDCSYLHANSCQEHQLITNCCCYNPYRKLRNN